MPENNTNEPSSTDGQTQDFEKMYSDSSREATALFQEARELHTEKVKTNPKYLIDLYDKSPKMAESIAKNEYGVSYEDAIEQIEGHNESTSDGINEDKIVEKLYGKLEAKKATEEAKQSIKIFYTENGIEGEFKDDFKSTFDDLMDGKKMTPSNVKKFLSIAFREVKQTSKHLEEYNKTLKQAQSGGLASGKGNGAGDGTKKQGFQILTNKKKPSEWY